MRTNNKLNPLMTPGPGFEPWPHWWNRARSPLRHPWSPWLVLIPGSIYDIISTGESNLFISLYNIFSYLRCIFGISYHVEFCYLKNRYSLLFKLCLKSFSDINQRFPHFAHEAEFHFLRAVFFLQNVTWSICKVRKHTKLEIFFWVSSTKIKHIDCDWNHWSNKTQPSPTGKSFGKTQEEYHRAISGG